ncbi:MAG TPA: TadE/TadG family type IV pilus assembly protein [Reyranella sp.]|nr:TadE/TadG family type IV pilus assembly protein [Reyranella sp.]
MRWLLQSLGGDSRGAAAIEFAIVGPLLFTFLLGIVEMGRMFYVRESLEYATEQAARYYMVNPSATQSAVTATLRNAMAGGMGSAIPTPQYTDVTSCNGNSAVTCTTITATYTFVSVASFLNLGSPVLRATAQAVRVQ